MYDIKEYHTKHSIGKIKDVIEVNIKNKKILQHFQNFMTTKAKM